MKKVLLLSSTLLIFNPYNLWAANLHVGDTAIRLSTAKPTSPAFATSINGSTWYAGMTLCDISGAPKTSYNGTKYSLVNGGEYTLFQEITNFNSCNTITLPAGMYRVEIRGGRGGNGGNGRGGNGTPGLDATAATYDFCLTTAATAYAFRGGDGNNGGDGPTGGNAGTRGGAGSGASSGADSALIVNGTFYKSNGGDGGNGGIVRCYNDALPTAGGGGGGGIGNTYGNGMNAHRNYVIIPGENFCMSGAGGGGAPSGSGGSSNSSGGYGGGAGGAGSAAGGGGGGGSERLLTQRNGGAGGATVNWSCGGQTLYSYGGGGAGAAALRGGNAFNENGPAGASGSSGTSTTSYVKIYKL